MTLLIKSIFYFNIIMEKPIILSDKKELDLIDPLEELYVRKKICAMCRNFYRLGWVSGTGGGISIRRNNIVFMAPSGVQKEQIKPQDIFILDLEGNILKYPQNKELKLTECAPLFYSAYELRNAGAVLHSHSSNVVLLTFLATIKHPEYEFISEYHFTRLEMLKGISGHGYLDTFILPIIENTPRECELTETLRIAIQEYPKSPAVAVKDHGIYVWGENEDKAKTQAECIDYICEIEIKKRMLGL
ncbi:MAG: methylthioribulose-1-phosphate dehydratase [Leptospiraceae bacterium]|nr:MAG: methylthioribulose-1-phosphate dehydratase [Leptospiraceae bacterium]